MNVHAQYVPLQCICLVTWLNPARIQSHTEVEVIFYWPWILEWCLNSKACSCLRAHHFEASKLESVLFLALCHAANIICVGWQVPGCFNSKYFWEMGCSVFKVLWSCPSVSHCEDYCGTCCVCGLRQLYSLKCWVRVCRNLSDYGGTCQSVAVSCLKCWVRTCRNCAPVSLYVDSGGTCCQSVCGLWQLYSFKRWVRACRNCALVSLCTDYGSICCQSVCGLWQFKCWVSKAVASKFWVGGQQLSLYVCVCVGGGSACVARPNYGESGGMLPQENIFNFTTSEIASGGFHKCSNTAFII